MAIKISDPVLFLQNLVIKKGRSDTEGVYLTNVTVVASAQEDYNYEYDTIQVEQDLENMWQQQSEWHTLLYKIKKYEKVCQNITFPYGISPDKATAMFFNVDGDLSLHVFIPELDASDFTYDVIYFTSLLQDMAQYSSKTCSTVKFTIGYCLLGWEDMVRRGEAQEMDVAY